MLTLSIVSVLVAALPQTTEELRAEILRACQATEEQGSFDVRMEVEHVRRVRDPAGVTDKMEGKGTWQRPALARMHIWTLGGDTGLQHRRDVFEADEQVWLCRPGGSGWEKSAAGNPFGFGCRLQNLVPALRRIIERADEIYDAGGGRVDSVPCRTYRLVPESSDAALLTVGFRLERMANQYVDSGELEIRVDEERRWILGLRWRGRRDGTGDAPPADLRDTRLPRSSTIGTVLLSRHGEARVEIPEELWSGRSSTREDQQ